jgi:predicted ester cyclase/heme-degrading monooxygenase HmoA
MKLLEPVERYFEAWNSHDGGAIAACFDSGGGYTDPVSGQLPPPGISAYASGLFSAFPDLRFELHVTAVDEPHVVAQWTMTGTQSGPLNGLPPTEARIKLPGIDVITLGEAGLLSVEGYFDQRTLLEQLGVQVTVQPANVGPLAFGTSVRFRSSNTDVPGALSMTWIDVHDEAEGEEIKQRSRAIAAEMARVPGFIGWVGIGIAERLYTLTLWDDPETVRQLTASAQHKAAARQVFETNFGTALHTGVWVPDHLNPQWQRCPKCGTMIDPDRPDQSCPCGEPSPARRMYV